MALIFWSVEGKHLCFYNESMEIKRCDVRLSSTTLAPVRLSDFTIIVSHNNAFYL